MSDDALKRMLALLADITTPVNVPEVPTPRTDYLFDEKCGRMDERQCAFTLLEHARSLERELHHVRDGVKEIWADRQRVYEENLALSARPEVKDTAWKAAMEERQWFEDKCKEHRATIRALAERCRPAVAHDARLREREVRSDKYAPHYKPALQAEAEKAGKLLDEIDALLSASSPQKTIG